MEIDLELTEKSAKNTQRWWKLTATIGYSILGLGLHLFLLAELDEKKAQLNFIGQF